LQEIGPLNGNGAGETQYPENHDGDTGRIQPFRSAERPAAFPFLDNSFPFTPGATCRFGLGSLCESEPRKSRVLLGGSPAIRESLFLRKFARRER
jgi:hypothetical protein